MDDGQLIELVAGFPALYNKNDSRFKNKNAREQAWQTIAEIMGCLAEDCSSRWVVLRAKYTTLKKQIRETPSGSCGYEIGWPHFQAMGFLDPFLVTRKTISNIRTQSFLKKNTESSEQQGPSAVWDTMSQIELTDVSLDAPETEDTEEAETAETDPSPPPTPGPSSKRTPTSSSSENPINPFSRKMAEIRRQNPRGSKRSAQEVMCESITSAIHDLQNKKKTIEEGDKRGLLSWAKSLAEDMSILTPNQTIIFKKKVYDILSEMVEEK